VAAVRGGQTFSKAIGVLRILAEAENGLTFTDLMVASGQPKATLHRLVQSMIEERLVRYDGEDRRYRLGYGFLELAGFAWSRLDIRVFSGDSLKTLSQSSGESVFLEILDGDATIVVDAIDNRRQTGIPAVPIGRRSPAYSSAAGKALLAALDAASVEEILGGVRFEGGSRHRPTSRGELSAQLALVRRQGFALEDTDDDGSCAIAAAIFDSRSRPAGAIGMLLPGTGRAHRSMAALTRMLTATAAEITHNWGGRMSSSPSPTLHSSAPAVLELVDSEPSWLPEGDVPC